MHEYPKTYAVTRRLQRLVGRSSGPLSCKRAWQQLLPPCLSQPWNRCDVCCLQALSYATNFATLTARSTAKFCRCSLMRSSSCRVSAVK